MNEFLARLEMISELAGNRHLMLDDALLTSAKFAMTGPVAFSAERARRLKTSLINTAWAHLDREEAIMDAALNDIAKDAHRAATQQLGYTDPEKSMDALSARLSQSHDASKAYLTGEITAQTNNDVNQVLRDYQNASLRTLMTADSKGISRTEAGMSVVMEEISIRRKLWFRDKLNRKIPSHKHIRRTWR